MAITPSVTTWIGLLKAGNPDAAQALWQRYFAQLVELARQHLARRVRRAADEEDVALSAFASFCAGVAAGRFPRLSDRHDLWRLLLTITIRHSRKAAEYETRARRDARRTYAMTDLFDLDMADLDLLAAEAPDPAFAAEVADELQHLLRLLPGDDLRAVAQNRVGGDGRGFQISDSGRHLTQET
jgi:hypothetical protein